jgi:AcrR family transcriptional regulator
MAGSDDGGRPAPLGDGTDAGRGTSAELKPLFPRLKPGPKGSPGAVKANQCARLHAAMIEACDRKGYAATTAIEVTTLAGVSKKTLYAHFDSKDACFLATYDLVVRQAAMRISAAYRDEMNGGEGDRAEGLCRAFDAFTVELVDRPAASRIALVDVLTLTSSARDRIECAEAIFIRMIAAGIGQTRDGSAVLPAIIRPLIGGVWFVARRCLLEGRTEALKASGAELAEWLLAYCSTGTTVLSARPLKRLAPGIDEQPVNPAASERVRMHQATAAVVARGGYAALSQGQVTEGAGLAPTAFTTHFEDIPDCFGAMLEWLSARALAEALRESEAASSWAGGVCRAVEALFCRIATDPALAQAAFPDALAVGSAIARHRAVILRGFADLLARRAPVDKRPSPVVAEAIVGSVWSIAQRHVARGGQKLLPACWARASFIALAPIVGAEEALVAIRAEQVSSASRPRQDTAARSAGCRAAGSEAELALAIDV